MKFNKEYYLDFPEEIISLGDYDFFYKTYLGTYNSKKVNKSKNKTVIDNVPLTGFEIVKITCEGRYSNSKKETLVIIKHPTLGFIFEVPLWDFQDDILLNNTKIENRIIKSECVIGFCREAMHYPIRLIPTISDKYKNAQILSTLPIPFKKQDLIEGAKYRFKDKMNEDTAIYVGTIIDGAFFKGGSLMIGDNKAAEKIHSQDMLIFQSCNDSKSIYLLDDINDSSIIETLDISNNIKGLDINLLRCTVLSSLYCIPKEIKVIGDNKSHPIKMINPLVNKDTGAQSYTTELFLCQESPTSILIIQEFGGEFFERGRLYISESDSISFEKFGDPKKYSLDLGYYTYKTKAIEIDNSCPKFEGDKKDLISVDLTPFINIINSYSSIILYNYLKNNIKLYNSFGKEILTFDFIYSQINPDSKINIDTL